MTVNVPQPLPIQRALFDLVWSLEKASDAGELLVLTDWGALDGVGA